MAEEPAARAHDPVDNPVDDSVEVVEEHEYVVPYDTKQQLFRILDAIKLHNDCAVNRDTFPVEHVRYSAHEPYKRLEPGEPLTDVELLVFRERWGPYASPCWGPALTRAVWFRNTGRHKATFDFLQWHLLRALPNVYYDGFPAITVYMHDEWTNSHIASSKLVRDERTRGEPGIEFDPLPAAYVTRTTVGNPAFRDLMLELGEDEPRAKRMRKNPHVPPYQSVYVSAEAPEAPPSTAEEKQGPYFFK